MLKPLFPTRAWLWMGRLTLLLLLLVVVGAGVFVGGLLAVVDESPPLEEFENFAPALITRVTDGSDEQVVAEFFKERREYLPMPEGHWDPYGDAFSNASEDTIPRRLVEAFMAIEDERYFQHVGVDPLGIAAAVATYALRGGRLRGGSTLTQQLARKTLEDITDERRFSRKFREQVTALQIEHRYSKETILEYYLNQVPLGNGIYGVQAAALNYFGVPCSELTIGQMATIAGIPPLPEYFNPRDALQNVERGRRRYRESQGPDDATVRRNLVLQNMLTQGYITSEEWAAARAEPMELGTLPSRRNRAPYFIDMVSRQIQNSDDLGASTLFADGVTIHSTIDIELQEVARRVLSEGLRGVEDIWQERKIERLWEEEDPEEMGWRVDPGERRLVRIAAVHETGLTLELNSFVGDAPLPAVLPYFNPDHILKPGNLIDVEILETDNTQRTFTARLLDDSHVQGAIVALDGETGDVLALVGGEDWNDAQNRGQWNRAFLGGRQPGSCFKPFVFAHAMEDGMTPATFFIDERVEFPMGNGRMYVPRNFENEYFGPTSLLEALEHSRNVVTILLTEHMGPRTTRSATLDFDFTGDRSRWNIPPYINLGLGMHDTTPLELACGYATFLNDGVIRRPRVWTHITDRNGRLVRENPQAERRIITRESARQVLRMMEAVVETGSGMDTIGSQLLGREGIPALAGKTGTTSGNVDAWFAGMTPEMVVVVFVGFDNNISLGPRMTGSRVAGPIWREFIREAMEIRPATQMEFPTPANMVLRDICSQTGLLWSDNCETARQRDRDEVLRYRDVPFVAGTEPTEPCPFSNPYLTAIDLPGRRDQVLGQRTSGSLGEQRQNRPVDAAPENWRMVPVAPENDFPQPMGQRSQIP